MAWDCLSIAIKLKEGKNPNQQKSNQNFFLKGELSSQYEFMSTLLIPLKMYLLGFVSNFYF